LVFGSRGELKSTLTRTVLFFKSKSSIVKNFVMLFTLEKKGKGEFEVFVDSV
jgi:hypothetical protein